MDEKKSTERVRRPLGRTAADRFKTSPGKKPGQDGQADTISAIYNAASDATSEVDEMLDNYLKRLKR